MNEPDGCPKAGDTESKNQMIDPSSSSYIAVESTVLAAIESLGAGAGWVAIHSHDSFRVIGSVGFPFPVISSPFSPEFKVKGSRTVSLQKDVRWISPEGQSFSSPENSIYCGCPFATRSGIEGVLSLLIPSGLTEITPPESLLLRFAACIRFVIEEAETVMALEYQLKQATTQNERLVHRLSELQSTNSDLQITKGVLETENVELRDLAELDGATGLLNHRAFYNELEARITAGAETAVAILDVDNFKAFNDQYGHLAGDEVLKKVGTILRQECGLDNLAARYGGEEFAIIFGPKSESSALSITDLIRQKVEAAIWTERDITLTAGIARCRRFIDSAKDVVGRADKALYMGKRTGKNRVLISEF